MAMASRWGSARSVLLELWWQQQHNEELAYCTLYPTKNDTDGNAMALRKALTLITSQLLWLQLRRFIPMASRMDYYKGRLDSGGIYHLDRLATHNYHDGFMAHGRTKAQ
ncbi:hypothetical protein O0I10_012005 [Lichtheimia ornata]|uniref:Uncharacterized protein n=1 Tax=Lichtheimia ornata TaxID=688661 RepID=A0AAD7UTK1_9FUNG|nr:uncharacterized protein O0I10_012005 [Lichtheimia ornata]KAJ8652382.1 hypothetical protein O0I10_012005 [Lichtheimia ornata]